MNCAAAANNESASENVIEVRGLCTRVGGKNIHRGVSFAVRRGEVLGVIGTSGSGKTFLLEHMMGLRRPRGGSVRVLGQPVAHMHGSAMRLLRRRWGVLFQQDALFSALSVFDNIAFPMRELRKERQGLGEPAIRELVAVKMHMVELAPEDGDKRPGQLSGGMRKRAALARALALEAELLILDEPTTGLDPVSASAFDTLISGLQRELGLTVVLVTHDRNSLAALSDRVAVLTQGEILTVGPFEEVAARDHPFIHDFFAPRRGEDRLRAIRANGG